MALIKCPECGKEISDKAPACIHCGCPMNQEPEQNTESSNTQDQETAVANRPMWKVKRNGIVPVVIVLMAALVCAAIAISAYIGGADVRDVEKKADNVIKSAEEYLQSAIDSGIDIPDDDADQRLQDALNEYGEAFWLLDEDEQEEVLEYFQEKLKESDMYEDHLKDFFEFE